MILFSSLLPYKIGDTRKIKCFAWLPVRVKHDIIWLERYWKLRAYTATEITVKIDDKPKTFTLCKWITLAKGK